MTPQIGGTLHRESFVRETEAPRRLPLLLLAGLLTLPCTALVAQQPTAAASSVAAPAPAPHPSALFEQPARDTTTLAAAEQTHRETMASRNHTITVSTTVIILSAVILILLIA